MQAAAVSQLKAQLALPFASSFSAPALLSDTPLQADAKAPDASQAAAVATPLAVGAAPEGGIILVALDNVRSASDVLADDAGLDSRPDVRPVTVGEAGGALQRTSGAAVRSVMENIISENRFEVFNSASSRSLQQKSGEHNQSSSPSA